MRIVSLASGSKGNAYVVEHGGECLLIDCGLNYRTLRTRVAAVWGETPPALRAVLLTHSHTDHTSGLAVLLKRFPDLVVYANEMTAEAVSHELKIDDASFACFENGQSFEIAAFEINPFSIPHDTSDPVGYLVKTEEETYFHGTDIGTPLDSVGVKLSAADYATLESNHDPVMLHTSGRPPSLIQRIAGPRGHLSNDQAAELVTRFASPCLKRLGLAHLSHDCNAPRLAEETMRKKLAELHRTDIVLKIYTQEGAICL